jgi:ligand-binding sensor domain-containing protein/putative methionine-R-sulfoxide reductase with GAF domain
LSLAFHTATGQSILFSHLNTSHGLSDNYARSIAVDNNGFLWIGTSVGLNVYDGYTVNNYNRERNPSLAADNILHLVCDSRNRVWIGTAEGASWIDDRRSIHRVAILDTLTTFYCPTIFETAAYGPVLLTDKGQFFFDSTHSKWVIINWIPDELRATFMDAEPLSENKIIFTMSDRVMIVDYATKKIIYSQNFTLPVSACPVNDQEIAVGIQTGRVLVINLVSGKTTREYQLTNQLNDLNINTYLSEVRRAANGDLLVATDFAGLISISKDGIITRHTHDPINPGSISANNTYRAFAGKRGEVVVGTYTSGANMGNVFNKPAGYTRIFKDKDGKLFDNYLNDITEEEDGVFWIGAYDRLIRWNRKTNQASFYYYYYHAPEGIRTLEVRSVAMTTPGRMLVSVVGDGLAIFDKRSGSFQKLNVDTAQGVGVRSGYIYDLVRFSDGLIWGGSNGGVFTVDPVTLKLNGFRNHPVLKEIYGKRVLSMYEDRSKRIWLGMGFHGLYCYDPAKQTLENYTEKEGMASPTVYAIAEDKQGNIYAATPLGLNIVPKNGPVQRYTRRNGLRYDRCASLMEDNAGNIWIANNKCLIKYNPLNKQWNYFEDNAGLSIDGFRVGSYTKAKSGELLIGSQSGINYFYPDQLVTAPSQLQVSLYSADIKDTSFRFSTDRYFAVPFAKNDVTFHFTAIDLSSSRDIIYQYKLEGYDKEWHTATDTREAHYTWLSAGNYTFFVRAGIDGVNWVNSNNVVNIRIIPPIWQRWWAIAGTALLISGCVYWFAQSRNRKMVLQQEQLETEQAINYFASSMYEQQKVENILWDVARNCIGRLRFEDCVIYLLDEERNVLVQKAAHGPKSPMSFEIEHALEIPLGKGIVGTVAATGKAEIIKDTTKDPRYILDDQLRYSEISVPMISDGKVLGVIDCEHSRKNFFNTKHLSILTTIASLCANKIVRARAEEEKEEAMLSLMETRQKMSEVEMQALRAQMNPHFIFNCLNSINRYIVKSDQVTASLYLTKFAKLIRLILDNSNSKNVILSNELEALKLYIDMEALRFDKKFSYEIKLAEGVPADSIELPPLIIQPYVENAIWHGLLHMQTVGHLRIHISLPHENMLQCVIEDNGIGRTKSRELKSKSATTKKSLGMKLTENRLSLLNRHAQLNASVEIIDLVKEANEPAGTKVILNIPI